MESGTSEVEALKQMSIKYSGISERRPRTIP